MWLPGVGRCAAGPAPGIPLSLTAPSPRRQRASLVRFGLRTGVSRRFFQIQGSYQPGIRIYPPLSSGIRLEFLSSWNFYPPGIPIPCSYLFELPCPGR
jgi:hypothetical protein